MRLSQAFTLLAVVAHISATALPEAGTKDTFRILPIDDRSPDASSLVSPDHTLEKRKGGGSSGGGGGGRGGGGGGSSGGGRSGGSSGGSSRTSGISNTGGSTRAGSGPPRSFGGGGYYGGGAAVPYRSGSRTPNGLVAGALLAPAAILLLMPGIWLYSAYPYYYNNPYRFYNASATNDNDDDHRRSLIKRQNTTGRNETLPVICLCAENVICGCDENTDQSYIKDLIGNGSYAALNKTLINVAQVNGTKTLILNGTLPNGTTAPGGTDDSSAAIHLSAGKYLGYWMMGLVVIYGVLL